MTTTKLHNMDQNNIYKLYQNGAFLVVQDVPLNTEFGIDYSSWSTGLLPLFTSIIVSCDFALSRYTSTILTLTLTLIKRTHLLY